MIETIDTHLAAAEKSQIGFVKKWWDKDLGDHLKPGPVYLFVRVVLDTEPKVIKEFNKSCLLGGSNYTQQYLEFIKSVKDDVDTIVASHPGSKPQVVSEQISFAKDEQDKDKIYAILCNDEGSVRKSISGYSTLIYEGWAKKNLKHTVLPRGDVLGKDGNLELTKEMDVKAEVEDYIEALIKKGREKVALLTAIGEMGVETFRKWSESGLNEHIKPGPVFIFVRVAIKDDFGVVKEVKEFKKSCLLDESNCRQQYIDFIKSVNKKIDELMVSNSAKKAIVVAEQISFAKDEKNKDKVVAALCQTDGTITQSISGYSTLIYEGWAKNHLKHLTLPRGDLLGPDGNLVLTKFAK